MKHAGIILFLGILALLACNEPICLSVTTSTVNIRFYNIETNERDTVDINSLRVIGNDSVLVENRELTGVVLPLNPNDDSGMFIFDTENGVDTLILSYQVRSRFVSEDCGVETIFSELNYTRSDFDSIRIVNNVLVESINEDLRIYN